MEKPSFRMVFPLIASRGRHISMPGSETFLLIIFDFPAVYIRQGF